MVVLARWLTPGDDEVFGFDAERFGDARDVVEVGDDLSGIVQDAVVEPVCAQRVQIGRLHSALMVCQFSGEFAQGVIGRGEGGRTPVAHEGVHEGVGRVGRRIGMTDLDTEIVCVSLRSVVAAEFGGDHCGQHFALHATERRFTVHDDGVEADAGL